MVFSSLRLLSRGVAMPTRMMTGSTVAGIGAGARVQAAAAARRTMGGHGPKRVRPKEYGGLLFPYVSPWHKYTGSTMITIMWLWIFYQTEQTWRIHLGLAHPWELHHDHGEEEHEKVYVYVKDEVGEKPRLIVDDEEDDE